VPLIITCPNLDCRRRLTLPHGPPRGKTMRCPHCQTRFASSSLEGRISDSPPGGMPAVEASDGRPQCIGRFEIRQRLGAGAFAAVFRAYDPQLDREVALKVPHPGSLDSPKRVERFLREAKAAAGQRHPHKVPLYEAGRDGDRYYIASAFIPGTTLADSLDDSKGWNPERAAKIARALAEALAYAHENGIVHRDVKPANVMLDSQGQPLLMDFGLASRREGESKLTNDGAVLGTPSYMAPEQASGKSSEAGPAADQYSLGCLLFELLTGQTPFDGLPAAQVYHHVHTEPPSPRQLIPSVPGGLAAVCLKCLEKPPERRYADCQALTADLARFLSDKPVLAAPEGLVSRAARWVRRQPVMVGMAAALLVTLAALLVALSSKAQTTKPPEDVLAVTVDDPPTALVAKEPAAAVVPESPPKPVTDVHPAAEQPAAAKAKSETDTHTSPVLQTPSPGTARAKPGPDPIPPSLQEVGRFGEGAGSVVAHPNGREILSASGRYILVCDAANGDLLRRIEISRCDIFRAVISPDGRYLLTAGDDGVVRLLNGATGTQIRQYSGHPGGWARGVAIAPDGRTAASGGDDHSIRIWDIPPAGQEFAPGCGLRAEYFQDKELVRKLGERIEGPVDWRYEQESAYPGVKGGDRFSARWSGWIKAPKAGRYRITVIVDDGARLRIGGKLIFDEWHVKPANQPPAVEVDLSERPSPIRLDYKNLHGTAFLSLRWKLPGVFAEQPIPLDALFRDEKVAQQAKVSIDGGSRRLTGHSNGVWSVEYSSDGTRLLSAGDDGTARLWDTATAKEVGRFEGHRGPVYSAIFLPDGRVATAGADPSICIWDPATGKQLSSFGKHNGPITCLAVSRDGRRLLSGSTDRTARLWDLQTGKEIFRCTNTEGVRGVAFLPGGERITTATEKSIRIWALPTTNKK
jgi:WD40 repeat protein/tRNA A-37 threonylcarbamoyl transferase component Bud32